MFFFRLFDYVRFIHAVMQWSTLVPSTKGTVDNEFHCFYFDFCFLLPFHSICAVFPFISIIQMSSSTNCRVENEMRRAMQTKKPNELTIERWWKEHKIIPCVNNVYFHDLLIYLVSIIINNKVISELRMRREKWNEITWKMFNLFGMKRQHTQPITNYRHFIIEHFYYFVVCSNPIDWFVKDKEKTNDYFQMIHYNRIKSELKLFASILRSLGYDIINWVLSGAMEFNFIGLLMN